jgi:hypothetical protein
MTNEANTDGAVTTAPCRASACGCKGRPAAMQPRDWFALGLRLIGAWSLVSAIQALFWILTVLRWEEGDARTRALEDYSLGGAGALVIGVLLLSGASLCARLAYPGGSDASSAAG